MKNKNCFKIISYILIQSFLLLEMSLAAEITTLSPQLQINQPAFQQSLTLVPKTQGINPLTFYESVSRDEHSLPPRLFAQTQAISLTAPVVKIIEQNYNIGRIKWIREEIKTKRKVYIINSDKGNFLFSMLWTGYSPIQIDLMKKLSDYLVLRDFNKKYFVPQIIPSRTQANCIQIDKEYYYLQQHYTVEDGIAPGKIVNAQQLKSAAKMLSEYHQLVKEGEASLQISAPEKDLALVEVLNSRLKALKQKLAQLKTAGETDKLIQAISRDGPDSINVVKAIDEIRKKFMKQYERLPQLLIYGDFQPSNILFKGNEAQGFVKFTHIKKDVRLLDFIVGILESEKDSTKINAEKIVIFFEEYMKQNNLAIEELEAMQDMLRLNYLNQIARVIINQYDKRKEFQSYHNDIANCISRIKSIDNFDWDGLIYPLKIRQIISQPQWSKQVMLLKNEFEDKDPVLALKTLLAILSKATYLIGDIKTLTMSEKMRFFSKALSLAITKQTKQNRRELLLGLDLELLDRPEQLEPEALFLCQSYLNVANAQVHKGTKVSTVIASQGEQDAITGEANTGIGSENNYIGANDFLRVRIEQLQDLYAVNKNFDWDLILVGDGDDQDVRDEHKQKKTIELAAEILKREYSDLYNKGKVRILELSNEQKKKISSKKGGSICLGMRDALNHGADYVIFINAVPAYHAAQAGLLLQELFFGAEMAIASRKAPGAMSQRSKNRELKTFIYNNYLKIMLPWTHGISDTQAGFKAFTRDCLEAIIPVDAKGNFETNFDYGLSFDTELISRAKILNQGVIQVPVARINFPKRMSTTDSPLKIISMILGIIKQRVINLKRFQQKIAAEGIRGKDKTAAKLNPTYKYQIFPQKNMIRVEGLSLHQGGRSVMVIRKTNRAHNYISQYLPVKLGMAVRGTVGYSALRADASGISTMEHLASALKATGLTGLDIRLYGAACPILDSTFAAWIKIFETAGWVKEKNLYRKSYRIQEPVILIRKRNRISQVHQAFKKFFNQGNLFLLSVELFRILFPRPGYDISPIKSIVLPLAMHKTDAEYISISTLPNIPREAMSAEFTYTSYDAYKQELAAAKTFIPIPLWEQQSRNMFMGALSGGNVLTLNSHKKNRQNQWTTLLKWPNEPARHKIADMIGDIYLTETEMGEKVDFKGLFIGMGSGHRDNIELGSMLKQSVELEKQQQAKPLMANITADGRLEYIDYDPAFVLKELKKLHKNKYIPDDIYRKIVSQIEIKHHKAAPLKIKTSLKNTFLGLSLTASLFWLAAGLETENLRNTISLAAAVLSWGSLYHFLQSGIMIFAKITQKLSGFLGIAVKVNIERADYLKHSLQAAGAGKITFIDGAVMPFMAMTDPDKTVKISDWVIDDPDYKRYHGAKAIIAGLIYGLNYLAKELLVNFVILDYEKTKLSWPVAEFINLHSYLLQPYQELWKKIKINKKSPETENVKKRIPRKISLDSKLKAENLLNNFSAATWRVELEQLIFSAQNSENIAGVLVALSQKPVIDQAWQNKSLRYADYENLLAKVFTLALKSAKDDNSLETIRKVLIDIAADFSDITPEAKRTAQSYLNVLDLKQPRKVSILFAMYKEQQRIQSVPDGGLDFLRFKIEQLEDLARVNQNFQWEMVIVNDGNDAQVDYARENRNSVEIAKNIVELEYPQYIKANNLGKIRFFKLPKTIHKKIHSRKGGAIMYGIWQRLRQAQKEKSIDFKPEVFVLTDADTTIPLSFTGILLPDALDSSVGMVIGSAQKNTEDVIRESDVSQKLYQIYNLIVQWRLPELKGIDDTLMGFKAARTAIFERILPFSLDSDTEYPVMDKTFVPRMAFDEDMLCRIYSAGYSIKEIAVNWIKCEDGSFVLRDRIQAVYDSLWSVRKDIKFWKKKLTKEVATWIMQTNDFQRFNLIDKKIGGSVDADKAASFLWIFLSKDLYKTRKIRKYLNKKAEDAYGHLTRQERVGLIAHALSLFLRSSEADKGYDVRRLRWLKSLRQNRPEELIPEARLLINSYLKLCNLSGELKTNSQQENIKINVISHLFGVGEKNITNKIEQIQDILVLRPEIDWTFTWVTQNDANPERGFPGSLTEIHKALARANPGFKDKVKIVEMSQTELARVRSVKGGSIIVGMAESISDKIPTAEQPDYIVYTDMNDFPHFSQIGEILNSLQKNNTNIAIGSRRMRDSIGRRAWFRRMISYGLNKWVWLKHKNLYAINDSQAGLKGFTRQQLKDIIPAKINQQGDIVYDLTFDYGLSFDVALMARACKKGYGINEIPLIDTFQMSARYQEHPLLKLYGSSVKQAIALQAKAVKGFEGKWQLQGQGGEHKTFSHPALNIVLQIPRAKNDLIYDYLVSGGDVAESTGRSLAMKLAALSLKTGFTRNIFYWYLHHSMKKNRDYEKKQLYKIKQTLGELIVPFEIIEQPTINVLYSYKKAVVLLAKQILNNIFFPVRWLLRKFSHRLIQGILRIETSIPNWLFSFSVYCLSLPIKVSVTLVSGFRDKLVVPFLRTISWYWPVKNVIIFIKNFLKFDRPGFILFLPVKILEFVSRVYGVSLDFLIEKIQIIPDYVPFVSDAFKQIDLATRSFWKSFFNRTNALSNYFQKNIMPFAVVKPEYALLKEKIVSFGDVLLRLDQESANREKGLKEAQELIERFIEFQKEFWRRGAFDYESHLLGDIGIDKNGGLVLVDLGVLTFNREEALNKLRPENTGRDFQTQEVLRQQLSAELYDYYIRRVREEVTPEKISALWGTQIDKQRPVLAPEGIPENAFIVGALAEKIQRQYEQLLNRLKTHQNERAPEYLGKKDNPAVIKTKVILRALRKGGWEERKISREIVESLALIVAESDYVLKNLSVEFLDWQIAFNDLLTGTENKRLLIQYLDASLIKGTMIESIFIETIIGELKQRQVIDKSQANEILQRYNFDTQKPKVISKNKRSESKTSFLEFRRDVETKKPKVIDAVIINGGKGVRQGLLSMHAGNKGDIELFGRKLKDWSADSTRYLAEIVSDQAVKPVLFSPVDVIFLKPRRLEAEYLEKILTSGKGTIFFSPQEKPLSPDLSRPLIEDLAELTFEVLLAMPGLGTTVINKIIIPCLRSWERNELIKNNGGYDFPGTWVIRNNAVEEAIQIFDYWNEKNSVNWWTAVRLPLRVKEKVWQNINEAQFLDKNTKEREAWMEQRRLVRRFVMENNGAQTKTLLHPWIDCNTPLDIFNLYRGVVNKKDMQWRDRLRETFQIDTLADILNSQIHGAYKNTGNFFIQDSVIFVAEGVTLVFGDDVVIDNSKLVFEGNPGETVFIPEGTVITNSVISGRTFEFKGEGKDNFLYNVITAKGFNFYDSRRIFVSQKKDSNKILSQEYEFTDSYSGGIARVLDGLQQRHGLKVEEGKPLKTQEKDNIEKKQILAVRPDDLPSGVTLVTGATGFIGSNLCWELAQKGEKVAAAVRPQTTNLSQLPQSSGVYRVDFDLTNPDYRNWTKLIEKSKTVYHFGAVGNQAVTMQLPVQTYVSNSLVPGILAAMCAKQNKKLIFSSTFVVYDFSGAKKGETVSESTLLPGKKYPAQAQWLKQAEKDFSQYIDDFILKQGNTDKTALEFVTDYLTLNPLPPVKDKRMLGSNYPLSKLLAEKLVLKFRSAQNDKNSLVLRLNNIYGPKQPQETMIPFLIRGIYTTEMGGQFSAWKTKRNLFYINDLLKILCRLETAIVPENSRVINIADNRGFSTREIAQSVNNILGVNVKIKEERKKLIPSYKIDNTLMKKTVGITQSLSLQEGLTNTIDYYAPFFQKGCTAENLLKVLKNEYQSHSVTIYQIVQRKRYPQAAVIRAMSELVEKGLVSIDDDRGVDVYSIIEEPVLPLNPFIPWLTFSDTYIQREKLPTQKDVMQNFTIKAKPANSILGKEQLVQVSI